MSYYQMFTINGSPCDPYNSFDDPLLKLVGFVLILLILLL